MMRIATDRLGSASSGYSQSRSDRVFVGQSALIHSAAHARSRWSRKPEQVSSIRQRRRRWISTADVVLGQRLLIDVHNSRAVHASGSHTHATEKLWRVWTVTETQNLNLNHGPSGLRRVGRRAARRKHGCQEHQDQHGTSHQMMVASRVSEGGIS